MTSSSVKEKWSNFFSDNYTAPEWFCNKLSILILIGPGLIYTLFNRIDAPYPNGLCNLINCNLALMNPFKWFFAALIIITLLLYLFEVKMLYTTLVLFLLSLLIYSIEESNGLRSRRGVLSLLFFAQFLAYLFQQLKTGGSIEKNRFQFVAQFIAAAYLLAAFSKLTISGLSWISDSPNVALQVIKSFDYSYFDTGLKEELYKGQHMSSLITSHTILIRILFGFALLLELFAFTIMLGKRVAFIYALFLLAMHIGTLYVMDIFFPTISFPLIIFLLNPLYLLYLLAYSIWNGIKPAFKQ